MTPAEAPPDLPVGGTIRRVAVVTIRKEPCALYLARRVADAGVEVVLVNQTRMRVEPDSLAYFRRFRKKYGLRLAVDYLLLFAVKEAAGLLGRAPGQPSDEYPVLRGDDARAFEVIHIEDINRGPGHEAFGALAPDLVLLAGAPVLNRAAIAVAKVACINPHCGITPDYAGGSPYDWAIYERRFDDVGYTIHLVVPTVDAGAILVQERVAWDARRPTGHLWPLLAQRMYDRLTELARDLIAGKTLVARPQAAARVLPPAGLFARTLAEARRRAYARGKGS